MALLYSRIETPEEIIITFKHQWIGLVLAAFIIGPGLLYFINFTWLVRFMMFAFYGNWWFISCMVLTIVVLTGRIPYIEINKAMRDGKKVEMSGTRFSSKNPLTYRIKK